MSAVSVNPIDTYIRNGAIYWPLPDPFVIGCDLAGTVLQVANDVKNVSVGQRVWCSNQGLMGRQGSFSELCAVDAHWLYPTPDSVSDQDAAACALVGITSHLGLFKAARLQRARRSLCAAASAHWLDGLANGQDCRSQSDHHRRLSRKGVPLPTIRC